MATTMTDEPVAEPELPRPDSRGWWRTFLALPSPLRWASYVAAGLVLLMVLGLVTVAVFVRRPFPQTSGTVEIPGLDGPVEVLRDDYGIPQVYADSVHDLMMAQGYVHAQERFYEMDLRRHVTSGRLSELFGDSTLETDKVIRTLGWRRIAEQELALVAPETRSALQDYADGVNAYLHSHAPTQIAFQYTVLRASGLNYSPADWTPADSLAWLKAMAWDLEGSSWIERLRVLTGVNHTDAELAQIDGGYPYAEHRPIVDEGLVVDKRFEAVHTAPALAGRSRPAYRLARAARSGRGRRRPARGAAAAGPRVGHRQQLVGGRR